MHSENSQTWILPLPEQRHCMNICLLAGPTLIADGIAHGHVYACSFAFWTLTMNLFVPNEPCRYSYMHLKHLPRVSARFRSSAHHPILTVLWFCKILVWQIGSNSVSRFVCRWVCVHNCDRASGATTSSAALVTCSTKFAYCCEGLAVGPFSCTIQLNSYTALIAS